MVPRAYQKKLAGCAPECNYVSTRAVRQRVEDWDPFLFSVLFRDRRISRCFQ